MAALLDATHYPHIVDEIVRAAPRAALLRLRAVNKLLRFQADVRLAEHVHLRIGASNIELRHPAALEAHDLIKYFALETFSASPSDVGDPWARRSSTPLSDRPTTPIPEDSHSIYLLKLFEHTRVVDISRRPDAIDFPVGIRVRYAFPNTELARFDYPATTIGACDIEDSTIPVVWFRPVWPALRSERLHYRQAILSVNRVTLSAAFDAWDPNLPNSNVASFFYEDPIEEVVLLLTPYSSAHRTLRPRNARHQVAAPRAPGTVDLFDYRISEGVLGIIEDFVFNMVPELERHHTIVGLESVPPHALGLDPNTLTAAIPTAVRAEIRAMLVRRRDDPRDHVVHRELWPDEKVDSLVEAVEILTTKEYRAKVGGWRYDYESEW